MRYDELRRTYPAIDELLAAVADQMHSAAALTPAQAVALIEIRISGKHGAAFRIAVRGKLTQFAQAICDGSALSAPPPPPPPPPPRAPNLCPYCSSIETIGGRCTWCHSDLVDVA